MSEQSADEEEEEEDELMHMAQPNPSQDKSCLPPQNVDFSLNILPAAGQGVHMRHSENELSPHSALVELP